MAGEAKNRLSHADMSPAKQDWAIASSVASVPRPVGCCVAGGMFAGTVTTVVGGLGTPRWSAGPVGTATVVGTAGTVVGTAGTVVGAGPADVEANVAEHMPAFAWMRPAHVSAYAS